MISVIVPIYKAEQTLRRCVDSLLAQTHSDFELLLVDDGSPDGSGAICDEYAAKDSRVRVFHKDNGGVSSARQVGLDHSRGEYLIHVDSDDWVSPRMLEELYRKAVSDDADMVICDYYLDDGHHQEYVRQQPTSLDSASVLRELFCHLEGFCWNKLVRRSCCQSYGVRFPHDLFLCEDLYFNASLLKHPIKVSYLPMAFYHYVRGANEHSICDTYAMKSHSKQNFQYGELMYDRFTALFSDSSVSFLVQLHFGFPVVDQAFWGHFFSSQEFKLSCGKYRHVIKNKPLPLWYKWTLLISCMGGYAPAYRLVSLLRQMKSWVKGERKR